MPFFPPDSKRSDLSDGFCGCQRICSIKNISDIGLFGLVIRLRDDSEHPFSISWTSNGSNFHPEWGTGETHTLYYREWEVKGSAILKQAPGRGEAGLNQHLYPCCTGGGFDGDRTCVCCCYQLSVVVCRWRWRWRWRATTCSDIRAGGIECQCWPDPTQVRGLGSNMGPGAQGTGTALTGI